MPFPSLGDLSNPGIEPWPLASAAFAGGLFTTSTSGSWSTIQGTEAQTGAASYLVTQNNRWSW